ncbi:MAG: 50S ribosomal protein L18 [Deltaproteobacteria bacterium]|nr:50S ribosomal protein L18 [Deltaproteobacteria bacterium]
MDKKIVNKKAALQIKRKKRIRKKVSGTAERPRLSVFRSARHVYAQVIDDLAGVTLVSASSFEKGQEKLSNATISACTALGKLVAERCKEKQIQKVVFDKNGRQYHGRVKALAEGAREGGLLF